MEKGGLYKSALFHLVMKVLLLGGNGLLGHNVMRILLSQGYFVRALVRRKQALHVLNFENVESNLEIREGSILNDEDLYHAVDGCEAIINCAGVTDMSLLHYEDYLSVNRDLPKRLVSLMESHGINNLVQVSTSNTIGYGNSEMCADESSPMEEPFASSYYAKSKYEMEQLLLKAAQEHPHWHLIIVNPGFMIGAYDTRPSSGALLLAGYRKPIMFAPSGGKSFLPVGDAAYAIVNALLKGKNGYRYLLTGQNMTLKQFYHLQARTCSYPQLFFTIPDAVVLFVGRVGDVLRRVGISTQLSVMNVRQLLITEHYTNALATKELDMPSTPIESAIKDFIEWYKKK